ncbi:hypothetical protein OPV22_015703 [Ensete ventricosum]|uniref:Uncharacterized protein n=1 Tax=Ensete ventricosum TaxID=4639 RepID=A0AAV8RB09_ENSVE|nr:hypothetical protein OPV22_015703 [Ensete ventricosum]
MLITLCKGKKSSEEATSPEIWCLLLRRQLPSDLKLVVIFLSIHSSRGPKPKRKEEAECCDDAAARE